MKTDTAFLLFFIAVFLCCLDLALSENDKHHYHNGPMPSVNQQIPAGSTIIGNTE